MKYILCSDWLPSVDRWGLSVLIPRKKKRNARGIVTKVRHSWIVLAMNSKNSRRKVKTKVKLKSFLS